MNRVRPVQIQSCYFAYQGILQVAVEIWHFRGMSGVICNFLLSIELNFLRMYKLSVVNRCRPRKESFGDDEPSIVNFWNFCGEYANLKTYP